MNKIIAVLTACLIILTLVSCSNSGKESSTNLITETNNISIKKCDSFFRKSDLPQPIEIGEIRDIFYSSNYDTVIILGNTGVCVTDSTFGVYNTFPINNISNCQVAMTINDDRIFIVKGVNDFETDNTSTEIIIYRSNGDMISSFEIFDNEHIYFEYISSIQYVGNEKILICDGQKCYIIDSTGKLIGEINSSDNISDVIRLSDGRIVAVLYNKEELYIREINTELMESGDLILSIPDSIYGQVISGKDEDLLYIVGNNAIYSLKSDNSIYELVNLTNSGIVNVKNIIPISDNNFLAIENGKLILLSERDVTEVADIQQLNLAVVSNYDNINGLIANFNLSSNKYRINVIDYAENYNYSIEGIDSAKKDLEMDIISGKIPDMVYLEPNEIEKLSANGAFSDLYNFMNDDKKYSKQAFLPNYLQACEKNGHLYSIQPSFMIYTIAAKKSIIDKTNWTIDEFMQIYESKKRNMELFQIGNNRVAVLDFITNAGMNYVDYANFSCNFASDEYIQMLEFAKQFPSVDEYDFEQKSCRDETAMIEPIYIESFRSFNNKKYEIFGDDMSFVGLPTNNGQGSFIVLDNQFAIFEDSHNKDGCWEFIRTILDTYKNGIPITKTSFDNEIESAQERLNVINESGSLEYIDEIIHDWNKNIDIVINPMTHEEAKYYSDFVTSVKAASSVRNNTFISSIISEETSAFFANECTAKECAERIQNRVSIYLSEQS